MKKNAVPEVSGDWWKSNLPDFLTNRRNLETSLTALERSMTKLEAKPDATTQQAALAAYKDVQSSAKRLLDEANALLKASKKPTGFDEEDCQNTIDALERFNKVMHKYREDIEDAVENMDGDLLGDVAAYTAYLKKILPKIIKVPFKPFNFAIAISAKEKESRIIFHKSKQPKMLATPMKEKLKEADISWGSVKQSEQDPEVLRLVLEGPRVSGAKKRLEKLLRELKITVVTKVIFVLDGKELSELEDETATMQAETVSNPPPAPEAAKTGKSSQKPSTLEVVKLSWEQLRGKLLENLRQLEAAILKESEHEPDFENIAQSVKRLYDILESLDAELLEDLSNALSAPSDDSRKVFLEDALIQVDEYLDFVSENELFLSLDTNPFIPLTIQATVTKTLGKMRNAVQASLVA